MEQDARLETPLVLREPDWRHQKAVKLAALAKKGKNKTVQFKENEDKTLRRLTAYLMDRMVSKAKIESDDNYLMSKHGFVHLAFMLKESRRPDNIRHAMEALALGGAKPAAIARDLACPKGLAQTYLECFYDVEDELVIASQKALLHVYLKAYEHSMFTSIGYKQIAVAGGVDRFRRIILDRSKMTAADKDWLDNDGRNLRSLYVWSKSWEALSVSASDPMEVQRFSVALSGSKSDKSDMPKAASEIADVLAGISGGIKMASGALDAGPAEPRLLETSGATNG
jgi:hypothetical protein